MRLAAREGGAIMMFVLLSALILAMVTLGVMRMVAGDITEGFGGLEAVQAFNIAEAGVHYAIGKLQAAGAGTYAGETLTISSGATTLGTATITVNCIDAGNPPGALVPPCSTSAYPAYRRIISTSTLPMSGLSGGPTRTIVAIVQGSGGGSYSICSYNSIFLGDDVIATGNVGNNAGTLQVGVNNTITGNLASGGNITLGGIPGAGNVTKITGTAKANSTITVVGSGATGPCTDSSCSNTVTGGWTPSAGLSTVCSPVTVGPFTPGSGPLTVPAAATTNIFPGTNYGDFTLLAGTSCGTSGTAYTNLQLQTGAVAGVTTVFQVNSITMNSCSRIVVAGAGNADLRLGTAGTALGAPSGATGLRVGAQSSDTYGTRQWFPAGRLMIEVNSSSATAVNLSRVDYFSGSLLAPNGTVNMGMQFQVAPGINGGVLAAAFNFKYNGTAIDGGEFTYDPTAVGLGSSGASNFNNLRSWKDQ